MEEIGFSYPGSRVSGDMTFGSSVLQKPWRQVPGARAKKPARRDTMGNLMIWAGTLLAVCLGMVLISLLTMARKAEEVYDRMPRGEKIATRADTYYLPASEILSPTSRGEVRSFGDLSGSVEAH
jgi:hypothetical protein